MASEYRVVWKTQFPYRAKQGPFTRNCRSIAEAHAILTEQYRDENTMHGGKVVDESIESRECSEWKTVEVKNEA
jgi:hypothetical protein